MESEFVETTLISARFIDSNLSRTRFANCNLSYADFKTAKNYNINPNHNLMKQTKFSTQEVSGLLNSYDIIIE